MVGIIEKHNLIVIEDTGKPLRFEAKPNDKWTKAQIKEYMDRHDMVYNSGDTKGDLLDKVASA
ncbi:hypothetical protein CMI48_04130 [Candidatus Pacearchaeota archaeon]|jgi:hypothetical protein|nr:hypothetical protein [Candidatus Pacearchaeota archaeon]|tara:strand:- start:4383 stop:4571 length:189 start_codon:yes stop_codon:yes gene_type:complete